MTTFQITGPDGKKYRVTGDTPEGALEAVKKHSAPTRTPAVEQASTDQPWYNEAGQALDDMLRIGSNAVTLGFRDKLAPYLSGRSVEEERGLTDEARDRAGTAGFAADVGGAMALPGGLAKQGLSVATAPIAKAMPGIKGFLARSGLLGLEGEALSSLSAAGNDQEYQPGIGMAAGVSGNAVGEGLSAAVSKVAGAMAKKPPVMTVEGLKDASRAAYETADNAGVIVNPQGLKRLGADVTADLAEFGYHPSLQPRIQTVLGELERLAGGNATFKGVDVLRKIASAAGASTDASERALSAKIVSRIDDYMGNLQPGDVLAGDPKQASTAIKEARDYWGRARKLETANSLIERAGLNAGATGSGGNVENATRQQLKRILTSDKIKRGFSKDEQDAVKAAVLGTPTQNALRLAGKLSPQGNGLMLALLSGGAVALPQVAIPAAVAGFGAKKGAEAMTSANVRKLADLIVAGGKKSALVAPKNATQLLAEGKREAIARALMAIGVQQGVAAGR